MFRAKKELLDSGTELLEMTIDLSLNSDSHMSLANQCPRTGRVKRSVLYCLVRLHSSATFVSVGEAHFVKQYVGRVYVVQYFPSQI